MSDKSKVSKWPSLGISLGRPEIAEERRGAYQAQALKEGKKVSEWAREILDLASAFSNGKEHGKADLS